jgi:hypothetical protein
MKTVLFVCYGSGHVRMVLPVARALAASGWARPLVLGLTTAATLVREAGLPLLQFKDVVRPGDEAALAMGQRLLADLSGRVSDPEESAAYLGLSFADLVSAQGEAAAQARYHEFGRQAFFPLGVLRRILEQVKPALLVATNSPRAERAAIVAAGERGIPAVCLVDLFAIDEVQWIADADYGQRVCVLNGAVKDFLVRSGRRPDQVVVTGNPAFDVLMTASAPGAVAALRTAQGWLGSKLILWPAQTEPARHPFDGRPGDPSLPGRVLQQLIDLVLAQPDWVLCVRPRAGEEPPALPVHPRIRLTGQDWSLPALLHAVDLVVTLNSTVGLEGHLVGARVLQVLGSVFDHAMPMKSYGIADEAVGLDDLSPALLRCLALPRRPLNTQRLATERVLQVLQPYISSAPSA